MTKFIQKIYVRLVSIYRCDRRHYEGQRHIENIVKRQLLGRKSKGEQYTEEVGLKEWKTQEQEWRREE